MPMRGTRRRPMTPARRARIFDVHAGVCGWCHDQIEDGQAREIDHATPLALGGADDDGPNAYPIHRECHRLKTFGRKQDRRVYGDLGLIAKAKRLRAKRLGIEPPKRGRHLGWPGRVRKIDGAVAERDGRERRMR